MVLLCLLGNRSDSFFLFFCRVKAILHLEKGIATRDDIDKTLRLGMGHPMGPLTLGRFFPTSFMLRPLD